MFWIFVTINTLLYGLYCWLGYQDTFKISPWFAPICLGIVITGNLLWITILKITTNHNDIFMYGVIWDTLLSSMFVIVPFLFCNIKLNKIAVIGLAICFVGLVIMKAGEYIEHKISARKINEEKTI